MTTDGEGGGEGVEGENTEFEEWKEASDELSEVIDPSALIS